MAKKIDNTMIIKINELYKAIGTYAGVSRELGIAPSTVKKYVDQNYICKKDLKISHVDIVTLKKGIEDFVLKINEIDISNILKLSEEEKKDIKEMWKELSI